MTVRVSVRAPLRLTEDPRKVAAAVANLFPTAAIDVLPDAVVAEGADLDKLRTLVREHQIPDSARGAMIASRATAADGSDDGVSDRRFARFRLGKQAAHMGHPHFGAPASSLGEIEVLLEADDEEELLRAIYWTAPDTTVAPELATVPRELRPPE